MASLTNFHHPTFHFQLNSHRRFHSKPISHRISQTPPPSRAIKASSSSPPPSNPKPSLLKTTCVTLTTVAALLSASLHLGAKSAAASPPPPPPPAVESEISSIQNDVEALRSLMKTKFETKNLDGALEILNRLIEIEPEEQEWQILKAQVHTYSGDFDSATKAFEEVLAKDPFRVEAYHGLVMAYSDSESKLTELEQRISETIEKCKEGDTKKKCFRDFMLLIAQIKVMGGNPIEALRIYQELVRDEPKDFRPYLCQGLIYTLMKKNDEADKQFEEFRRLVPEDHPYKDYFDANVLNTTNKLFR